jgi:O-antigen/teichoic acid export membrane protein
VRYGLARRLLPEVTIAPRARFDRGLVAPFLRRSAWIGVIDVATIVVFRLDLVVVGLALGVRAAAVYAVAQKLTFAIEQLIQATTKAFFPHASELEARNDMAGLRASLLTGTRAALLVAIPLALTLSLLAAPLLHAWVGHGFDGAVPVVVFLSLATVIVATTRTGLLMLQATSTPRVAGLIYGGEAILNAALSIGLALTIGLKGVALGTLIAAAVGAIVFIPFLCRQFGMPVHEFLVPVLRSHLPSVALTLAVGVLVTRAGVSGVLVLPAAGAMLVVYLLAFLRFGLAAGERHALAAWLRGRRGRRRRRGGG